METIAQFVEWLGEDRGLALGGLLIGAVFGFFAQRSQFCLRAAVVEVARAQFGPKLAVWLLAFAAAIILTQSLLLAGQFDTSNVRQLASQGSVSGAAIGGLLFGLAWLGAGIWFARRHQVKAWGWIGGIGAGLMVGVAWWFTWRLAGLLFEPTPVQSLSFTGPSADVLMLVLSPPGQQLNFDLGMVPGVFLGSFIAAWFARELKLEGFQGGHAMRRYIIGAVLMGFGGMLAGGCAVGAGVSGASVFAVTAWVTLTGMWVGASFTDWLVDRQGAASFRNLAAPSAP